MTTSENQSGNHTEETLAKAPLNGSAVLTEVEHGADETGTFRLIQSGGTEIAARQAVSCLVAPRPGDKVLISTVEDTTYILAVLERSNGGDGEEPLRLETPGHLHIAAQHITLHANAVSFVAGTLTMVGTLLNSLFKVSRRISGRDSQIAKVATTRAVDRISVTDNADIQSAGLISQDVDGPVSVRGDVALVRARGDIRFDGERINVG